MDRDSKIRAREQAATESLISRLAYCMDGGYTTHDTIRSLCQEAMITINRLTAKVEALEAEHCPGCLPDGLCRRMPDGTAEQLRAEHAELRRERDNWKAECAIAQEYYDMWKARAEALEAELAGYREAEPPCKVGDAIRPWRGTLITTTL